MFSNAAFEPWANHPWNVKNGGFLSSPAEFFTNIDARRRSKMWLRYAAARWGASSHIVAWQLYADTQASNSADLAAWEKEMAAYLRSVDPYGHLIVGSDEHPL
jgi:endo-1,4-beta-mannosidase